MKRQEHAGSSPFGAVRSTERLAGANGDGTRAAVADGGRNPDAQRNSEGWGAERREVVDRDGVRWRVYELTRPGGPGKHGGRCLVFDSDAVVRRVATYPAGGRDLSPADLLALSWGR